MLSFRQWLKEMSSPTEAGYSGAVHMGPGNTGKHIAVFDPKDIVDHDGVDE